MGINHYWALTLSLLLTSTGLFAQEKKNLLKNDTKNHSQ